MDSPRAVVIPFGVPAEGRGLGLGLAALVHGFAQLEGGSVAIAQLQTRPNEGTRSEESSPIEAFLSPAAWRDIAGRGDGPAGVALVLTGAFDPPLDGHGTLQLLAFDPRDGRTCARLEAAVDGDCAGASLVEALGRLCGSVGGGLGVLDGLRELGWDALESVLRAERCALHDPLLGRPYDSLAAMLHLGRAIGDAPSAPYPIERLASIALETVGGFPLDVKLAWSAVRALERAIGDAPSQVGLIEARGALLLRLGQPNEAERAMNTAIAVAPGRTRPYALLSQSLRAQGKLDGALTALQAGPAHSASDPFVNIERGMVLLAQGDASGADAVWRDVLARDPLNHVAFVRLASSARRHRDATTAEFLIDTALASKAAHPDVYRSAIELALGAESKGLARAVRIVRLSERLLQCLPGDPVGLLSLAREQIALGDPTGARARLLQLQKAAPASAAAAEGQLVRLALDNRGAELELQSTLRAAQSASVDSLEGVAARGRRCGREHEAWTGWLAAAIAERRRGRPEAACAALDAALALAPGAVPVHAEFVCALLELGDVQRASAHAEAHLGLEGPTAKSLGLLARTHAAAGRHGDAVETARRALSLHADDENAVGLMACFEKPREPAWTEALLRLWQRFGSWFRNEMAK